MRLLLRKDIERLGHVGDVVEVSNGYARNYLIPHHLGVEPTPANLRAIEIDKKRAAQERLRLETDLRKRAENLQGVEVTIAAAANEEGHLYGSVGVREIAAALRELGHSVESSQVRLASPIRQLDTQAVEIYFREDILAEVKVWVVRERAGDVAARKEGTDGTTDADDASDRALDSADALDT
jgi:large subunit ribosomal protein L9